MIEEEREVTKRDTPVMLAEAYPHFKIGVGTYGDLRIFDWGDGSKIEVGNYSSFAFQVDALLGGEHRSDWCTTYPFTALWPESGKVKGHPFTKGNISIGSDVWVAAQAMILSGVTIGNGAVIGARSVVVSDIPPYAIAAGSPAKVLRYRFDPDTIAALLDIAWWTWPKERIVKALPKLLSENIHDFITAAHEGTV